MAHPDNWADKIAGGGRCTFVVCSDSLEVLQVVEVRLSSGMTVVETRCPMAAAGVVRGERARSDRV